MATDRLAFIPWNESQAGNFKKEYEINQADRGKSHHKRKWSIVYLDSPGTPLGDIGFGFGTRICVAGHGNIGWDSIAADHGTGGANRSYTDVVDLMFQKGLKKRYVGTVACDVCYSALGSPPFAKLLARELWSRGVKASCVLGYKASMYAQYYNWSGGKYTHRVVDSQDKDGNAIKVKTKDMQERFYGWT